MEDFSIFRLISHCPMCKEPLWLSYEEPLVFWLYQVTYPEPSWVFCKNPICQLCSLFKIERAAT